MLIEWLNPLIEWFGGNATYFFLACLCVIGLILIFKRS